MIGSARFLITLFCIRASDAMLTTFFCLIKIQYDTHEDKEEYQN